ncbi:MAG: hypothetical protein WAU39_08330 [Polyangiales bacterium]
MKSLMALVMATCLSAGSGCAGGRVSGGQGTEMQQQEEYLPAQKVEPPEGNTNRVSGPINSPTPPPVLEVDLERRRPPPPADIEPEPGSSPLAGPETER